MSASVQEHYGTSEIVAKLLAAVPWSPESGVPLTPQMLFPFDQLHGRELLATQDHAARLAPAPGAHLLDIGSGVGGPARYFAACCGCRVTGVDLTPAFVAASRDLAALCGLQDLLSFVEADATRIPLADGDFDQAYSFYVGMNLPDRSAVMRECFRLLKPGGRLLWTDVATAPDATDGPHYPLPWAATSAESHLESAEELAQRLRAAGFDVTAVEDETGAHLELARQIQTSGRVPAVGQIQANEVVLGPDFVERRRNYIRSLGEGRIASVLIEARRPV